MRVLASVTPFLTEKPTSSSTRILLVNLPLSRYEARKSPSLWTRATQPREPSSYWIASPVLGFVPFVRVLASVTPFPTEKQASASTRILLVNLPLSRYGTRKPPSLRDWTSLPRELSLFIDCLAGPWFSLVRARTCVSKSVSNRNASLSFHARYAKSNEAGGAGRGVRQQLHSDNQVLLHSRKARTLPLQLRISSPGRKRASAGPIDEDSKWHCA